MNSVNVINNIFDIQTGDLMQIYDDNRWSDLGYIHDKRAAAVALGRSNFTFMKKPVRIIRVGGASPIESRR